MLARRDTFARLPQSQRKFVPKLAHIGSRYALHELKDRRERQENRTVQLNRLANVPPNGGFNVQFDKLSTSQSLFFTVMIFNIMVAPATGRPFASGHSAKRNESLDPSVNTRSIRPGTGNPSYRTNLVDSARTAAAPRAERHHAIPRHKIRDANSWPLSKRSPRAIVKSRGNHSVSTSIQSRIQQSFSSNGNPLGDRLAEGIVVRLPGWPTDRDLQIVEPDQNGDWKPTRTYPAMRNGKPVRLYLRDDGTYIAIAEQGSPFGDGAQIAEPRIEQRGDSFYIAVQHALFPNQRAAMGIERWNENEIGALRGKVHAFSIDPDNKEDMDQFYSKAMADTAWRETVRDGMNTQGRPFPHGTSTPEISKSAVDAILCRPPARLEKIGPANPLHTISCHLYVHDDVPLGENRIVARYIQWWLDEMTPLLPAHVGLQMKVFHQMPGITDMDYTAESDRDSLMMSLQDRFDDESERERCPDEEHGYHLLLTGKNPQPGLEGLSWYKVAIASIGEQRTVGHELGHMFGATHEDGEVLYANGWWQETAMFPHDLFSIFRSKFLGYSSKNRENIRLKLAGG
jgi:hypothetical protein